MTLPSLAAPLVFAALAAIWLAVQRAWLRRFSAELGGGEPGAEPDALAARGGGHGCGSCARAESCQRRARGACRTARRETS